MSKKGFLGGKNSNAYIVFYSTVMVVIVALLLAFTSLSLKDKQEANELNEKKNAIVASLGLEAGTYDQVIEAYGGNAAVICPRTMPQVSISFSRIRRVARWLSL